MTKVLAIAVDEPAADVPRPHQLLLHVLLPDAVDPHPRARPSEAPPPRGSEWSSQVRARSRPRSLQQLDRRPRTCTSCGSATPARSSRRWREATSPPVWSSRAGYDASITGGGNIALDYRRPVSTSPRSSSSRRSAARWPSKRPCSAPPGSPWPSARPPTSRPGWPPRPRPPRTSRRSR